MKNKFSKNGYLVQAKKIFKLAKKEYNIAKSEKNKMKMRQSAEKGYLALLKITDALFIKCGVKEDKLPKGERGRLHFLGKYGDRDFRRKYSAIYKSFHIDAFHEGIIEPKILDERFLDLGDLIKIVDG